VDNQHAKVYVPEGITFGRKVAIIPSVSMAFSHSGDMASQHNSTYTWIDRGSPLGVYRIAVDKVDIPVLKWFTGTDLHSAIIPSPVSGLLIHANYDFAVSSPITAILLADDEPLAENGEYMFRNLCNLCRDKQSYFLKPSRYWSLGAWTAEDFNMAVQKQLLQKCEYVDALPKYKDYFDEIRTRHPNLRPLIRHLQ